MQNKEKSLIKEEIVPLTSLRGIAALWVVILHFKLLASEYCIDFGLFSKVIDKGYMGVDFFFILSGFIISYVYMDKLSQPSIKKIFKYLIFRLGRIYPLHFFIILIYVFCIYGLKIKLAGLYTSHTLILNLFNVHGWEFVFTDTSQSWNNPSWTISTEWFSYLLFPLLAFFIYRIKSIYANIFLIIFLSSIMFLYCKDNGFLNLNLFMKGIIARTAWEFICGMCLFNIYLAVKNQRHNYDHLFSTSCFILLLIILFFKNTLLKDFICVFLLGLSILFSSKSSNFIKTALSSVLMKWLGINSYSIYMIHFICLLIFKLKFQDFGIHSRLFATGIYISIILLLAHFLYTFVEKPCRDYFRNLVTLFKIS